MDDLKPRDHEFKEAVFANDKLDVTSACKPNSNRYKEAQKANNPVEKRAEKVVTGPVKIKKKSEFRKAAESFFAEDLKNIGAYVWKDIIIPTIKNTIADAIHDSVNMALGTGRRGGSRSSADRVSYSKYYDRSDYRDRDRDRRDPVEPRNRGMFDYENISFDSRGEAEKVLAAMDGIMEQYNLVRVGDLYDLVGETGPYTANDYGWTNIRNAEVTRGRDGYYIKMPRAIPIK